MAIVGLAVVLAVGAVGLAAIELGPEPAPATPVVPTASPVPLPPLARDGFLVGRQELEDRVARGRAGEEPYATALADLVAWADGAVGHEPDPQEPLDIPGTEGPFVDDTAIAYGLGLAWVATGDARHAERAADIIRAWTRTTKTTRNTCSDGGECQTSLIVGRVAPGFVFAADLISPSGALSSADEEAFRAWLRDVILPTASERDNNWGDAGLLLRVSAADYLGDGAALDAAYRSWREMMDLVEADGHIPEEVRRGRSGIQYTQEALLYKVAVARIAERRGVDLWSYRGTGGADLRAALDFLARYMADPAAWPFDRGQRVPDPAPMWEIAQQHYRVPAWEETFVAGRPYGADGHSAVRWTTLTNGLPARAAGH